MTNDDKLSLLRIAVAKRMSEKRFLHTLGVESAAKRLGEVLLPDKVYELRAAALLHDVTKELSYEESLLLLKGASEELPEEVLSTPAVLHSFTAPWVIKRDFHEYASEEILSAVRKHTLGDRDMSIFDEIIFIADYVEDGRSYQPCVSVRDKLFSSLSEEGVTTLHKACVEAIRNTESSLIEKGKTVNPISALAKTSLLSKI